MQLTEEQVTAPGGVDFGDYHVPQGVRVAVPNLQIQQDPEFHHEADRYNAFRFAQPSEASTYLQQKQTSLSVPSDKFLAWGHGRHACPGRFFAAYLMKIMLAHVLINYDVKAHGPKPKDLSRGEFLVPSLEAIFDVRRR